MSHAKPMWETAATTEHSTLSARASERRLAADGAAATEHSEESASAFEHHVPTENEENEYGKAMVPLVLLQSTPPPTHEINLLQSWAA